MTEVYFTKGKAQPDYTMSALPNSEISLYQMAEILLNRTRQVFESRGVLLPNRQIIYLAPLPVDCEQLAVLISGWVPTPGFETTMRCSTVRWMGQFDVIVSRPTPAVSGGKTAPKAEQMSRAAKVASDDMDCLLDVVRGLGEIGAEFQLETAAPQGNFQTSAASLQIPAFGGLE